MSPHMRIILTFIIFASFSHASIQSVGEPQVKWRNGRVNVCFADAQTAQNINFSRGYDVTANDVVPFTKEEKQAVSEVLLTNYNVEDVGIGFVGFQDCSEKPDSELYLVKFSKEDLSVGAWSGFIGEDGVFVCDDSECIKGHYERNSISKKAHVAINVIAKDRKVSDLDRLRITLLHEFGHAAGLRHEHIRPEALTDPNCKAWMSEIQMGEGGQQIIFGKYDSNSIMSYCYIYHLIIDIGLNFSTPLGFESIIHMEDSSLFVRKDFTDHSETKITIKLSEGDKHSLKCLYVYNDKKYSEKCVPDKLGFNL